MRYVTRIILFRGFSHACILDIQLPALNESSFQHSKTRLNVSFSKASSALHVTKEYTSRLLNETRNIRYLYLLIFSFLLLQRISVKLQNAWLKFLQLLSVTFSTSKFFAIGLVWPKYFETKTFTGKRGMESSSFASGLEKVTEQLLSLPPISFTFGHFLRFESIGKGDIRHQTKRVMRIEISEWKSRRIEPLDFIEREITERGRGLKVASQG